MCNIEKKERKKTTAKWKKKQSWELSTCSKSCCHFVSHSVHLVFRLLLMPLLFYHLMPMHFLLLLLRIRLNLWNFAIIFGFMLEHHNDAENEQKKNEIMYKFVSKHELLVSWRCTMRLKKQQKKKKVEKKLRKKQSRIWWAKKKK